MKFNLFLLKSKSNFNLNFSLRMYETLFVILSTIVCTTGLFAFDSIVPVGANSPMKNVRSVDQPQTPSKFEPSYTRQELATQDQEQVQNQVKDQSKDQISDQTKDQSKEQNLDQNQDQDVVVKTTQKTIVENDLSDPSNKIVTEDKKVDEIKKDELLEQDRSSDKVEDKEVRVSYYLSTDPDNLLVVIPIGELDGVMDQSIFRTYRMVKGIHVVTGTLKVIRVYPEYSVARVIQDHLGEPGVVGNLNFVMASDVVKEYTGTIEKIEQIVEDKELRYQDIFEESGPDSLVLSLSENGRERIKETVLDLMDHGVRRIMIESHSGDVGDWSSCQLESEQRGNIVKYFIDEEFGLDSVDTLVVGFGKQDPKIDGNSVNIQNQNRRIIIKAI